MVDHVHRRFGPVTFCASICAAVFGVGALLAGRALFFPANWMYNAVVISVFGGALLGIALGVAWESNSVLRLASLCYRAIVYTIPRGPLQFALRSLLLVTLALAAAMGTVQWLGIAMIHYVLTAVTALLGYRLRRKNGSFPAPTNSAVVGSIMAFAVVGYLAGRTVQSLAEPGALVLAGIFGIFTVSGVVGIVLGIMGFRLFGFERMRIHRHRRLVVGSVVWAIAVTALCLVVSTPLFNDEAGPNVVQWVALIFLYLGWIAAGALCSIAGADPVWLFIFTPFMVNSAVGGAIGLYLGWLRDRRTETVRQPIAAKSGQLSMSSTHLNDPSRNVPKRWWIVLTPLLIVVCGLVAWRVYEFDRLEGHYIERESARARKWDRIERAAQEIKDLGGRFPCQKGWEYEVIDLTHWHGNDSDLAHLRDFVLATEFSGTHRLTISARGTTLSDAAVPHLTVLTNMKKLIIADTQITDAGVNELIQALPHCEIIVE